VINPGEKIGLFIPCYIDQFYPQAGIATFELLLKLGFRVEYPPGQTCCGQPLANSGAENKAIPVYLNFIKNFCNYDYIVAPSGSCVYHVREHYDILEQTETVNNVRGSIYELCDFLVENAEIDKLHLKFPFKVGLHHSCHGLRGLKLEKSSELMDKNFSRVKQLLEKVEGIELVQLDREDECCGFGGTFSVFEPDVSVRMGEAKIHDHEVHGAEIITATDSSCLMHLEGIIRRQNKKIRVMHIAEILNHC